MVDYSVRMIPVAQLHENPDNPRIEAGDVSDLLRSFREVGRVLEPLLVVPAPGYGHDHYLVEDGLRRLTAGRHVFRSLPCIVMRPLPEESFAQRELFVALTTDLLKHHLAPMERARAMGRLRDEFKLNQTQIAKSLGVSVGTVSRYLGLMELSDKSQRDVATGRLSVERALDAVKTHRAKNRAKAGQKPIDVGWNPDHFTDKHALSKRVRVMCDAKSSEDPSHGTRRRYGGGCHFCWEIVIRQDEASNIRLAQDTAGKRFDFVEPLVPITPDGGIRVNGVTGAE